VVRRGRGRTGLLFLSTVLSAAGPAAADDVLPAAPIVRVLLIETKGSVRVTQGSTAVILEPGKRSVLVDGAAAGRVWRPSWPSSSQGMRVDGLRVRGGLAVRRTANGIAVINQVGLEDYVLGTVGREAYSSWHPEMLKAQAVVTRTYALHQMARNAAAAFDVEAGTRSQVYGGVDAENAAVRRAVRATDSEYLAHRREPILAVFHSSSGGRTATAQEVWGEPVPYLVSIDVENEEDSPDTYWRASISRTTLGRALAPVGISVGSVRDVEVSERSESGRAAKIRVSGTKGIHEMEARALRTALGASVIRSTLFEIREFEGEVVFVGSGHGHGVGMSQWGAQAMAKSGADHRRILATFYPGTKLMEGSPR